MLLEKYIRLWYNLKSESKGGDMFLVAFVIMVAAFIAGCALNPIWFMVAFIFFFALYITADSPMGHYEHFPDY